jgi:hypothetical protein
VNAVDNATWAALLDVYAERRRQDRLRDEGRFAATLADKDALLLGEKLAVITEEIGECARCVLSMCGLVQEELEVEDLRKELVQVAALACAWIESLDAEGCSRSDANGPSGEQRLYMGAADAQGVQAPDHEQWRAQWNRKHT